MNVIELAKQEWSSGEVYIGPDIRSLHRFANAVLEEAAKKLDDNWYRTQLDCANAIRAMKGE